MYLQIHVKLFLSIYSILQKYKHKTGNKVRGNKEQQIFYLLIFSLYGKFGKGF